MEPITKKCSKCGQVKEAACFSPHKLGKLGRQSACRICTEIRNLAWRAANPDKVRARMAKWRESNQDKVKSSKIRSYQKNKDSVLAKQRAAYKNNPEIFIERNAKYRTENAETVHRQKETWRRNNLDRVAGVNRKNAKIHSGAISDLYVVKVINHKTGLPASVIRQHPELIERTALVLQGHRIFKQLNQPTPNQQTNG